MEFNVLEISIALYLAIGILLVAVGPVAEPWIGGDPLLAPYSKEETKMLDAAARMVGDNTKRTHSDGRSRELPEVNKTSTVANIKKNRYGV